MDEQKNKVASVIGASCGIGAAVVEWLTRAVNRAGNFGGSNF